MVPDMQVTSMSGQALYEWKVATMCDTWYPASQRYRSSGSVGAEKKCSTARRGQARTLAKLDALVAGLAIDRWREVETWSVDRRPVMSALQAQGGVQVMAIGAFGESSKSVLTLLRKVVAEATHQNWMRWGYDSQVHAKTVLQFQLQRRWGMGFCRAQAQLLCRRLRLQSRETSESARGIELAYGPEIGGEWSPGAVPLGSLGGGRGEVA